MSRKIARFLGEVEESVSEIIQELEAKNGYPSHDARFIASNAQISRSKLIDLGLDPEDTTAEELYHALIARFEKNSSLFDIQYGAQGMAFDEKSRLAASLVSTNFSLPQRWALKNLAARKIMRQLPPKHLMKYLKYRSVDSMLKREKTAELYLAAAYSEPAIWQKNLVRLISKLDATDFELRKISIITLESDKWSGIGGPENWLALSDDIAAAAFWPSEETSDTSLLLLSLVLIDGLNLKMNHRPAKLLSDVSGILEWWSDMDHTLAEFNGSPISLNILDIALNHHWQSEFDSRELEHGRKSFWKEFISRYENLPPAEALFEETTRPNAAKINLKIPQPAFELAEEEFDG